MNTFHLSSPDSSADNANDVIPSTRTKPNDGIKNTQNSQQTSA